MPRTHIPMALFAGSGRLDGRVQREQVRLEGDAVDQRRNVGDLAVAFGNPVHGSDHVRHQGAAFGRALDASAASWFAC